MSFSFSLSLSLASSLSFKSVSRSGFSFNQLRQFSCVTCSMSSRVMTTPAPTQPLASSTAENVNSAEAQKPPMPRGGGGSGGLRRGSGSGSGGALYNRRRNSSGDKLCRGCFIRYEPTCPFSIENLPYGVFSTKTNVSKLHAMRTMYLSLRQRVGCV